MYNVDADRIYLMGHSLGAMAAGRWQRSSPAYGLRSGLPDRVHHDIHDQTLPAFVAR
jgi:hypothetical protein